MPRGHTQWPAGLFWPDCEHRIARPGPCCFTLDRGDGIGGGERACPSPACDQRAKANAQTRGAERNRRQGVGLRDLLSTAVVEGRLVGRHSHGVPISRTQHCACRQDKEFSREGYSEGEHWYKRRQGSTHTEHTILN